ncbi:hypothetical protein LXL04_003666 [Taraxacum kok-saghyz]
MHGDACPKELNNEHFIKNFEDNQFDLAVTVDKNNNNNNVWDFNEKTTDAFSVMTFDIAIEGYKLVRPIFNGFQESTEGGKKEIGLEMDAHEAVEMCVKTGVKTVDIIRSARPLHQEDMGKTLLKAAKLFSPQKKSDAILKTKPTCLFPLLRRMRRRPPIQATSGDASALSTSSNAPAPSTRIFLRRRRCFGSFDDRTHEIFRKQSADVKKQTVFFLQTVDVWSTSSAAEACRCGPQTADLLASKKQTPPKNRT